MPPALSLSSVKAYTVSLGKKQMESRGRVESRMVIESRLDTDLYKFTMMQVVLHHFPGAQVEYVFKCRTPGVDLGPYADEIRASIADLCKLRVRDDELAYLRGLRFMK